MPQAPQHLVIYIIVYQDMMVWKPGKLQSHKIEDLCLMLSCTSPCTNPLSQLHLKYYAPIICFHHPGGGGGATQGDFTANVDTGGGMLTENRNLGWG
jgi:hypothetical protein